MISTSRGAPGRLDVVVQATTTSGAPANRLRELRFSAARNATIVVRNAQSSVGGFSVGLPDRPSQLTFSVYRQTSGLATTVPLVAVDDCGDWTTFVGGGPSSF